MKRNLASIIGVIFILAMVFSFVELFKIHQILNSTKVPAQTNKDSSVIYLIDTTNHIHTTNNIYQKTIYPATIPQIIDTEAIIKDYFTKVFAVDSIQDSLVKINIFDTIFNNRIAWRKYNYKLLKPYEKITRVTTTNTFTHSVNGLYAGAFFAYSNKSINGAGIELDYVTKRFNYGLGYDVLRNSINGKILIGIKK